MKYRELVILLPCHSFEDFPVHHEGEEAEGLLANWSALWHPALLRAAGALPQWKRVDEPPEDVAGKLLVAPAVSHGQLPVGFAQRCSEQGAVLIRKKHQRQEIVWLALEGLDGGAGPVGEELAADFLALGYCYLQVELLTRRMRYSSNLDMIQFTNQTLAAAEAAMSGDEAAAKVKLGACFDLLAQERNYYYPVDAYLVDLTLVAGTTLGEALRQELAAGAPVNALVGGEALAAMAAREPETLAALGAALEQGRAGLLGGEFKEGRAPLLGVESLLGELRRGAAEYQRALGRLPRVFARRRYGLTPFLPQVLAGLGFRGALHATLDEGRFPEAGQIRARWEGVDGAAVEALARAPLDATKPETFLRFGEKLGESMEMDHVATVMLAHWPGQASCWHQDLRRVAKYAAPLGQFITLEQYFEKTQTPSHGDRFEADQYAAPYLKQAVIRRHLDPISSSARYWRRRAAFDAAQALATLACLVRGRGAPPESTLEADIDALAELAQEPAEEAALDARLDAALQAAIDEFASVLPRQNQPPRPGLLVFNPCSFVRRATCDAADLPQPPAAEKPVYAADKHDAGCRVVVDVPPLGFAWAPAAAAPPRAKRGEPPLAEPGLLRNEFFEAVFNPTTGALQAVHDYKTRANRVSQQLALRVPAQRPQPGQAHVEGEENADYSVMAADETVVTQATSTFGELVVRGRLLDREGAVLARFTQTARVWRGSRVLRVEAALEPLVEPRADPWNSYYCARFAWGSEAATLTRNAHQVAVPTRAKRLEAPLYVELDDGDLRTTLLMGGLPFHQRVGRRMLDTLLIARGERQRVFAFGVGVELPHPLHEALDFLTPPTQRAQTGAPPAPAASSWLFHVDARNILATHWSPLHKAPPQAPPPRQASSPAVQGSNDATGGDAAPPVVGARVRLLETAGKRCAVTWSAFRDIVSARQVNFLGETIKELAPENGKLQLQFEPHAWQEIEAYWK